MQADFPQESVTLPPRKSYEQVIEDITKYMEAAAVASLPNATPHIPALAPIVEEAEDDDVNPEVERLMEGFLSSVDDEDMPTWLVDERGNVHTEYVRSCGPRYLS